MAAKKYRMSHGDNRADVDEARWSTKLRPFRLKQMRFILECNHTLHFHSPSPHIGDVIYCNRCEDIRKVIDSPDEYVIKCLTCRYTRQCGANKMLAEVHCSKHAIKHKHYTNVMFGQNVTKSSAISAQPTLFEPDF